MSIYTSASGASLWRGYEYYVKNKVKNFKQLSSTTYEGIVGGTQDYHVFIDVDHLRRSHCDCPHANGRRVICKHAVALFFTIFPDEAKEYNRQVIEAEKEEEKRQEEMEDRICNCIKKMKKEELQNELYYLLMDSPEWVIERFIRENDPDY